MSKPVKRLIALAAVLVLLIVALVAIKLLNSGDTLQNDSTESVTIGSLSGALKSMSFTGSDGSQISFDMQNGIWVLSDRADLPLQQSRVERIANSVLSLQAVNFFEVADTLSAYGLETPKNTFTATDSTGTLTLLIGTAAPDGSVYVMEKDGDVIYTIDNTLPDYLDSDRDSFVQRNEIPALTEDDVDTIVISDSAHTLTFTKNRLANGSAMWYVEENGVQTQAAAYELSGDGQKATAREYLNDILAYLAAPGSEIYNVEYPEQTDSYGFDTPALTVHVEYRLNDQKSAYDLTLGSAPQSAGTYPARLDAFAGVYAVPEKDMAPFFDALDVLGIAS